MSYEYKLTKTIVRYGEATADAPLPMPTGEGWVLDKMSTELLTFPLYPVHDGVHHDAMVILVWRRLKPPADVA